MRVGIVAILHESNTFIGQPTTIDHFCENLLLTGESIRDRMASSHHEVGGMFAGLAEAEIEAVPLLAARAIPFGTITASAFDRIVDLMLEQLGAAGPLDGVLVAPHGATVSEHYPDADGHWLRVLREHVGETTPIIGTLDPHANVSAAMIEATHALIAYRTNPHLDQRQCGLQAASLMARTLGGEIRPAQAACFPPMAINIERQNTSEPHCRQLYDQADAMLSEPGVLSNSIILGFPYADVAEMGSSAIVVTDANRQSPQPFADRLGRAMWELRHEFLGQLTSVEEAVRQAREMPGPVCLLDMGDNVGGGSPADGTVLARELRRQHVGPSIVCLYDPDAAKQAIQAGIGARIHLEIGGKSDDRHGLPLVADFEVIGAPNGQFDEPEPRHGGFARFDQGPTAVVRADRLTILVNSVRTPPFSIRQLTSCGIDPSDYQVLVAKGVNAPVAAYAPVCKSMLRVNTPGVTCADMTQLPFRHRRRPLFPFS